MRFPLLYEDEMSYYKYAEITKAWGSRGTKGARKANQTAGSRVASRIAAGIDVQTGKLISRQRTTYPAKEMYRFFYHIEQHYKEAERIFIVLDNWPPHFSEYVKENLARGARKIVLLSLPTYARFRKSFRKSVAQNPKGIFGLSHIWHSMERSQGRREAMVKTV